MNDKNFLSLLQKYKERIEKLKSKTAENSYNEKVDLKFFKIKKFQCKSLKGRGAKSGIRVIYAYLPIEQRVVFVEIYFKANQENENRQRIVDFININKK